MRYASLVQRVSNIVAYQSIINRTINYGRTSAVYNAIIFLFNLFEHHFIKSGCESNIHVIHITCLKLKRFYLSSHSTLFNLIVSYKTVWFKI